MVVPKKVRLETVMSIETGSKNTENKVDGAKYPFFVRSQIVERIADYSYDCEAVLTAGDGVGTGKVFHYIKGKFDAHQRVYVMSQFNGIDGKYFFYYFSRYFFDEVAKYTAKSSVDSVRRAMIADMEIPLPSLLEQRLIAEALADTDALILALEKLIDKKRAIKQGTMQELLTGKRRLDGFSGEWTTKPLLECCDLLQGLTYSPNNVQSHGLLVLRSSNIQGGQLAFDDCVYVDCIVDEMKYVKPKDILICVRNGSSALIGKSCVIDKAYNATFGAFMSVLRGDTTGYIAHIFGSDVVQQQIRNRSNATINQITKRDFEEIKIPVPYCEEEQIAIASILSDMDAEIDALNTKLDKFRNIKQGMMSELLTGRIRLLEEV